jgi:hypothetical protein
MKSSEQVQLIVIDDSVRFAFHVWRYLGRSIGIGGGSVENPLGGNFWSISKPDTVRREPRSMWTADGRTAVWWVPGDSSLRDNLTAVLNRLDAQPWFFLIDMRGQPAGSTTPASGSAGEHLDLGSDGEELGETALRILHRHFQRDFDPDQVMMVSSYETGVLVLDTAPDLLPFRIWPKSPDTLARLEERLFSASRPKAPKNSLPKSKPEPMDFLHILVTGAGFEIRSDPTGGFGLPLTGKLLTDMGHPFGKEDLVFKPFDHKKEKLPCLSFEKPDEVDEFQAICDSGDLDVWWNYLLERELRKIDKSSEARSRGEMKMLASVKERKLREAFRRTILTYDVGHLNQTLGAARQDWHAWLTTNYTRFSDRAIALREAWKEKNAKDDWRIISTSIEALSLSRELLHEGSGVLDDGSKSRYLFKLHGDVAHLQTMATAGQDKEFFSSLSLPVDSLHQVYVAAEVFLQHSLRKQKKIRLVWHIVGHDLQDSLLLGLIARVCRDCANPKYTDLVVVKRNPPRACGRLKDSLKRDAPGFEDRVKSYSATAEDYLARIAQTGGLPKKFKADWAEKWLEKLGKPAPRP